MTIEELITKEVANLPKDLQRQVYDFAPFLREKSDAGFDGLLLSHSVLRKDWDMADEDAAWENL